MAVRITDGALSWTASIDDSEMNRVADRMENRISALGRKVKSEGTALESWAKSAATAAVGYLTLQGVTGFISSLVQVRSEFQQLDVAFRTMLRSKVAADRLMKEIVDFAGTTPYGMKETAGATKQLLAYGSSAKTVMGELRMLGDVASGVSVPIGDLVYLYGTLKTQGRAYAMDIRQFAGRGIPIYAELAKVLKINKDEVAGFVEAGKVGFPQVEQAFKNMTAAGSMFGGLMEAQSKTWTGQIERFKDAWDRMLNEIGKSQEGLFDVSISAASTLVENYQEVIDIFTVLIGVYGVYRAATAATIAFEKASEASRFGLAIALNQESVARIANANALAVELRAEVSSLAVKRTAALQIAALDAQTLKSATQKLAMAQAVAARSTLDISASTRLAKAKAVEIATEEVMAAKEKAGISRKAALATSSEFYAAKQKLETTAKVASSAATVELTAVEALNSAGKRVLATATAAYNAVLAASPIIAFTAVVSALGIAIYSLTQITDAAKESQKALSDAHEEGGKSADSEGRRVQQLIDILKDHKATVDQQKTAYDKLLESTGGVLKGYTAEQIAADKATKSLEDYIIKIREAASARKAFADFNELADKMDALDRKGIETISNWTRVGRSLKNTFAPSGISLREWANELIDGKAASKRIVDQEKEVLQTSMDTLKKQFGGKFTEILTGQSSDAPSINTAKNKAYYDAIIKKNTEDLEALDSGAKDFASKAGPIKKRIDEARAKLLLFDGSGKADKQAAREENKQFEAEKRKADMINKIYQLNEKYNTKSLTDDEQKLAQIRADFQSLQTDIDTYNKDPKNIKVNENLNPIIKNAVINQEYENETGRLKIELEKQKSLYDDYEDYKTRVGQTEANSRYENEIDTSKALLEKLKEEAAKLEENPLNMTGPQIERLKLYYALINQEKAADKIKYQEAYQAAMSHEDNIKLIREKYVNYAKNLGVGLTESKKNELIRQQNDEIEAANETAFQKTAIYKRLAEETVTYTKEALRAEIKAAQNILKDSGLSPALKADVEKHIEELNKALDLVVNKSNTGALEKRKKVLEAALIDPLIAGTEQAKAYREELLKVQAQIDEMGGGSGKTADMFKGSTKEIAGNISGGLNQLSGSFGELSSSLEGVNDGLAYTLGSIGELMKVGEDAAGAVASFAAGDIIGGVTKTISAVSGLFNIGKKVKEMNAAARKEVADYYEAALNGEREYQTLLRKRELDEVARGKTSYQAIVDRLELLKKQSPEIQAAYEKIYAALQGQQYTAGMDSKHGTWFRKAKTWDIMASLSGSDYDALEKLYTQGKLKDQAKKDFEALKALREELKAAGFDVEDLQLQLNEMLTGTSVEGLSDALSDLFENLKLSSADFGGTFENIMRNAILNSFKLNVIQKAMAPVFDMLSGMFSNGSMPGEQQIDQWLDYAKGVGAGLGGQFGVINDMMEKLGLGPGTTSSPNSLAGAYSTASQESINLLTGQTAGMRQAQLEANGILGSIKMSFLDQLAVANAVLEATLKIVTHTGKTATNTDRLEKIENALVSINNKMSSPGNAVQAAGFKL